MISRVLILQTSITHQLCCNSFSNNFIQPHFWLGSRWEYLYFLCSLRKKMIHHVCLQIEETIFKWHTAFIHFHFKRKYSTLGYMDMVFYVLLVFDYILHVIVSLSLLLPHPMVYTCWPYASKLKTFLFLLLFYFCIWLYSVLGTFFHMVFWYNPFTTFCSQFNLIYTSEPTMILILEALSMQLHFLKMAFVLKVQKILKSLKLVPVAFKLKSLWTLTRLKSFSVLMILCSVFDQRT